jgi:hypothetical protein
VPRVPTIPHGHPSLADEASSHATSTLEMGPPLLRGPRGHALAKPFELGAAVGLAEMDDVAIVSAVSLARVPGREHDL